MCSVFAWCSAVSQVATRLVTFSLNVVIARHLTPKDYAVRSSSLHKSTVCCKLACAFVSGFRELAFSD